MNRRFDVLLLDSGGTIFDLSATTPQSMDQISPARFTRAAQAARIMGWPGDGPSLSLTLERLEPELKARLADAYGFDKLLIEAGKQVHPPIRPELALLCTDAYAGPRFADWVFPRTADAFQRFQDAGIVLAVVANTPWPQTALRRAMAGVGLEKFFDAVVCSCDIGIAKPDRGIFEHTLKILGGAQSRRFCYVGDSLRCDIQGAAQMGWSSAFRRSAAPTSDGQADFEFDHWDELVNWIIPCDSATRS